VGTDTVLTVETLQVGAIAENQVPGTVVTLGASGTIPTNTPVQRVTAAGPVAGIILSNSPTPRAGQRVTVIHEGAAGNTLTMAASGTSFVANGVSCVITGPSARTFVWDSVTALWYQCT